MGKYNIQLSGSVLSLPSVGPILPPSSWTFPSKQCFTCAMCAQLALVYHDIYKPSSQYI